jgi:hypothetical protein
MIKSIFRFFRNLWKKEIDYEFEFEIDIYDVILVLLTILFILWITLK